MRWDYRHEVLALAVLGNFAQFGSRVLVSPVVPDVIDQFDTSKAAVGLVLTLMWAVYALLQFPSGLLADRFGPRRVVVAALGLTAAGSLLVAVAPSMVLFGLFVVLLGAGAGLYFTPATTYLATLYDDTGQALGFHTGGGAVAGLVAPVAAAGVSVRFGWRWAVALGVLATLPLAAAFGLRLRDTATTHDGRLRDRVGRDAVATLVAPGVAAAVAVGVVGVFSVQGFLSFYPTFLEEFRGVGPEAAGLAFGGAFLLSAVAQPAVGRLSDRAGRDLVLALSFAVAAAGFTLSLYAPGPLVYVGAAVLGAGISWPGVIQANIMDALPGGEQGLEFGMARTAYMLLGASGSVVTGTLADVGGWPLAFGTIAGLLVTAAVVLVGREVVGRAAQRDRA